MQKSSNPATAPTHRLDVTLTSEEVQAIKALDIGKRGGPTDTEQVNARTFPITIQDWASSDGDEAP